MQEYLDAQQTGEVDHPESCNIAYGNVCPVSIFNYFNEMDSQGPHPQEYHSSHGYNVKQPTNVGFEDLF